MKQKKKKPAKSSNKFDFDHEVIIGISSSSSRTNKVGKAANQKKTTKTNQTKNRKSNNSNLKKKQKKKKSKINIVKIFVVLMLLIGSGCFLCLSPMFNIENIVVEGASQRVSAEEVSSLSGIPLYTNIFLINKKEIEENIGRNSYVDSVEINRVLPNKIKITIKEREPAFLIEFTEGKYIYLSQNGYILEASGEKLELPILIGFSTNLEEMIKNENNKNRLNEEDLERLDIVIKIFNVAKNYEVDGLITKIDVSDSENYKLILESEEKTVYLGKCNDLNTRILWMKEIMISEKGNKGEIFVNGDLNEDAPFFRESV